MRRIEMDFFDAAHELHSAISRFVGEHGENPVRISVSPRLFQWLTRIQTEEMMLKGKPIDSVDASKFLTEYGELDVVIDERLSDFEIVPE